MMDRMHYRLEVAGETATLHVSGSLGMENVETLIGLCATIPNGVRSLSINLLELGQLSAEATGAVRRLLTHWRDSRQGEFRLSTSYMFATLREARESRRMPVSAMSVGKTYGEQRAGLA